MAFTGKIGALIVSWLPLPPTKPLLIKRFGQYSKVTAKSYRLDSSWVKKHPYITSKEVEYSRFYSAVEGN